MSKATITSAKFFGTSAPENIPTNKISNPIKIPAGKIKPTLVRKFSSEPLKREVGFCVETKTTESPEDKSKSNDNTNTTNSSTDEYNELNDLELIFEVYEKQCEQAANRLATSRKRPFENNNQEHAYPQDWQNTNKKNNQQSVSAQNSNKVDLSYQAYCAFSMSTSGDIETLRKLSSPEQESIGDLNDFFITHDTGQ